MSFSASATGGRDQVVGKLNSLDVGALGQDPLGSDIRDLVVRYLGRSADAPQGMEYAVNLSGHAGSSDYSSQLSMTVTVQMQKAPEQPAQTQAAAASEPVWPSGQPESSPAHA